LDTISHHYLIEFYGIPSEKLDDLEWIQAHMLTSLSGSGATYVNHYFHKFTPQGVSGVIVIAESHLSIHTWPESEYAALDVFTCGDKAIADSILNHLTTEFNPTSSKVKYLLRGDKDNEHFPTRY
jgi:S-adenosylmethionine decarboxylase proenzyme